MSEDLLRELEKVAMEIDAGISSHMEEVSQKRGLYDRSAWNWASQLHHPCDRNLVYARLNWKDQKPKSVDSLFRLTEGNKKEDEMVDLMAKAGYRIKLGQMPLQWDKFKIRGRIDGAIPAGKRKEYPAEVKSVSPWYWNATTTIDRIKGHNKFWISRIPSQLNLYLLMRNDPAGFLILTTFGARPRIIPMLIDYDLGEQDLQQAERVNKGVASGELPPRIPYASDICELCDFDHICQPIKFAEISEATPDQVKDLKRYIELFPASKELEQLKKKLIGSKDKPGDFYGKNVLVEDIEISTKQYPQAFYDVPGDIKMKYKKSRTITKTTIGRIG